MYACNSVELVMVSLIWKKITSEGHRIQNKDVLRNNNKKEMWLENIAKKHNGILWKSFPANEKTEIYLLQ